MTPRFVVLLLTLLGGCTVAQLTPRPSPADTAQPGELNRAVEAALRRYLGPSRFVRLAFNGVKSDGTYDYASYHAQWQLMESGAWEAIFHTKLIFVKRTQAHDWKGARVFIAPEPSTPDFSGPIDYLDRTATEFGNPKPYGTDAPGLVFMPGTR